RVPGLRSMHTSTAAWFVRNVQLRREADGIAGESIPDRAMPTGLPEVGVAQTAELAGEGVVAAVGRRGDGVDRGLELDPVEIIAQDRVLEPHLVARGQVRERAERLLRGEGQEPQRQIVRH